MVDIERERKIERLLLESGCARHGASASGADLPEPVREEVSDAIRSLVTR